LLFIVTWNSLKSIHPLLGKLGSLDLRSLSITKAEEQAGSVPETKHSFFVRELKYSFFFKKNYFPLSLYGTHRKLILFKQ